VLLGRTFEEYRCYFVLQPQQLIGKKILDTAGRVSSLCAEANSLDIKVTAFDPIYSLSSEKTGNDPMPIWNRFTEPSDAYQPIAGVLKKS
jgi:hypothetical protein